MIHGERESRANYPTVGTSRRVFSPLACKLPPFFVSNYDGYCILLLLLLLGLLKGRDSTRFFSCLAVFVVIVHSCNIYRETRCALY